MLWAVRHLWMSGASFVFNCYHHWSSLVLRNGNGTASFLHSREVVTQGDPIKMITYGIVILPLINNLKREIPDVTQPWYADAAGYLSKFARIETYFDSLTRQVPGRGYYYELSNSILIVHSENIDARKEFGARHEFKVCTGARYIGGYIGDGDSKRNWLRERTLMREKKIITISKTVGKYPQGSYAAGVCEIQSVWIFLQCVTWDTGYAFAGVEKMIWGFFALYFLQKDENPLTHCRNSK